MKNHIPQKYSYQKTILDEVNSRIILAEDKQTQKKVVLKYILPQSPFYKGFFEECLCIREIEHPNLVEILETGYLPSGVYYYVIPYYPKLDPIKCCREKGIEVFLEIFQQILNGLNYLHERDKLHGDISLDNVLIYKKKEKIKVKITDFGLSSLIVAKHLTDISGTAYYLAPELLAEHGRTNLTQQTDLYSTGILLSILLTGEFPKPDADPLEIMKNRIKNKENQLTPTFPMDDEIISIIDKMLAYKTEERYKSCQEVIKDINPILSKYRIESVSHINSNNDFKINLNRKQVVDNIVSYLNKNKIVQVFGDETKALNETINFLYDKLVFKKNYVTRIEKVNNKSELMKLIQDNFSRSENLERIIHKKYIVLISDIESVNRNFEFLNKLVNENENFKLILINRTKQIIQKEFDVIIRNYSLPKLTNKEFETYLTQFFGKSEVPIEITSFIEKNAHRNLVLINDFLKILQEQEVIRDGKLQRHFFPENIHYDFYKEKSIKKYLVVLKLLNKDDLDFLTYISFWKEEFTVKEIHDVFQISSIRIQDFLANLKEKDIVVQNPHSIKIQYFFLRSYIRENTKENFQIKIRKQVISYLSERNELSFSEQMMFLTYLQKNKNYAELLQNALELSEKYRQNRNYEKSERIGEIVYISKDALCKINPDESMLILLNYEWILDNNGSFEKAKKVFYYLEKLAGFCRNKDSIYELIVRRLYIFQNERNFRKITNYYEKEQEEIRNLPDAQKVRILFVVSNAYYKSDLIDKSIELIKDGISICRQNKELTNFLVSSLSRLGFYLYRLDDNKNALKYYVQAKNIAEKESHIYDLGYIYCRIAFFNFEMFQFKNAREFYKKAELFKKKWKIYYFIGLISNGLGHINLFEGNLGKALTYFHKNKLDNRKTKNDNYYHTLARTLFVIGYYNQAEIFIKRSIKLIKSEALRRYAKTIYLFILFYRKDFKKFWEITSELEKESIKRKIYPNPEFYYIKGLYYFSDKNGQEMEKTIIRLKENADLRKDVTAFIYYHHLQALFYLDNSRLKTAVEYIDKAIRKLEQIGNNLIEAPKIYYDAYQIHKPAFRKNISTEDYKKFLEVAYKMVWKRSNSLPTIKMRRTYWQSKHVFLIIQKYEEEMKSNKDILISSELLEVLEEISGVISKVTNKNELFSNILEIALKATKAERGLILTKESETGKPKIEYTYQLGSNSLADVTSLSEEIIDKVLIKKKAVFNTKVTSNDVFDPYRSFVNLKIQSIICLPLIIHNQVLGTVYLDSRSLLAFTPEEMKFLNIFAQIAASAIETSQYYCRLQQEKKDLSRFLENERKGHKDIIGSSEQLLEVLHKVEQIAPTNVNVLIEGESGTGKEIIAKDIHRLSKRKNDIFIPIDCGSLSEDIIESELFGHQNGAFTGAVSDKKGLFEEADRGTVFLDEISNISLNMQTKLLRLIQEGEFKRVGENVVRKADVRLIVASNLPLKKLVAEGKFRQDLFYRLSIFPVEIPPLRERKADVSILANHFLDYFSIIHGKNIRGFQEKTLQILEKFDWPGNVRQLQNEIERAVILFNEPDKMMQANVFSHLSGSDNISRLLTNSQKSFNELINDYKHDVITETLKKTGNSWTKAAHKLKISRQNLRQIYKRIKK